MSYLSVSRIFKKTSIKRDPSFVIYALRHYLKNSKSIKLFNTRIKEHLFEDRNSHIFKHLNSSKNCKDKCGVSCFKIIDTACSYYQLMVKENFHIEHLKPELKQIEHVSLALHF